MHPSINIFILEDQISMLLLELNYFYVVRFRSVFFVLKDIAAFVSQQDPYKIALTVRRLKFFYIV